MNVYEHKFISRLGLMHMIATNLCVWLSVLILETNHEISGHKKQDGATTNITQTDDGRVSISQPK